MVSTYQISSEAIAQIKSLEGFQARATRLADGRWAVGYGHVASTRENSVVTRAQADLLLRYDLNVISEALSALIFTPLNSNQIDALGSFVYNIGLEAFKGSTVLRLINAGALLEAAAAMEQWRLATVSGQSQEVDGLIRRRAVEKALFLKPEGGWVPVPSRLVIPHADGPDRSPEPSPELYHDSTAEEPASALEPAVAKPAAPEPDAPEPDSPDAITHVLDPEPLIQPAQEAEPEPASDLMDAPTDEEPVLFPATTSVARRTSAAGAVGKRQRKTGARPIDFSRVAILGLIALGGLASIGFAISLGLDSDASVRQNPQTIARVLAIGITGLLAVAIPLALLWRTLNPKA